VPMKTLLMILKLAVLALALIVARGVGPAGD
jgi:hypothetical protein